jgi:hypothetical protein
MMTDNKDWFVREPKNGMAMEATREILGDNNV